MEAVAKIGHGPGYIAHGPGYIAHAAGAQNESLPFTNGKIYIYVMTRVPGKDLEDIYEDL